jgi:two-component system, response regulator PdtaR
MMMDVALRDAGYDVVGIVTSGEDAVDLAYRAEPHLAVLDIGLAGELDGIDTAHKLRRAGTSSLFATARRDEETRLRASGVEPLGWIDKPFTPHEVVSAIAAALEQIDQQAAVKP